MLMHLTDLDLQVRDRQARLRAAARRGCGPLGSARVRIGRALIAAGMALAGSEREHRAPSVRPAKPAQLSPTTRSLAS
jgi:hypothetical protein